MATINCDVCNKSMLKSGWSKHQLTTNHLMNLEKQNEPENVIPVEVEVENNCEEPAGFLEELNNVNFKIDVEEPKSKSSKKKIKFEEPNDPIIDDELFSNSGSAIQGKNRLVILNKIKQYKALFSKELKTFKIKKNATEDELKEYLDEIETLITLASADLFILDVIMNSLKLVEGASKMTRFNITGLSDMLKSNPQFLSLTKQLYLKYNTFINIPSETQLVLIVIVASYSCIQKNKNIGNMDIFLNEPIGK